MIKNGFAKQNYNTNKHPTYIVGQIARHIKKEATHDMPTARVDIVKAATGSSTLTTHLGILLSRMRGGNNQFEQRRKEYTKLYR